MGKLIRLFSNATSYTYIYCTYMCTHTSAGPQGSNQSTRAFRSLRHLS